MSVHQEQTHPIDEDPRTSGIAGQRWAVTGAAGTIGRAVRSSLAEQGVQLLSLDIAPMVAVSDDDTTVACDLRDLDGLVEVLRGCDGVIHLGAIPDEADFHDLAEVNIVGTYHLLEAARRSGVGRVVHASSNRVTGFYPVGATITPDMPPRPDGFYGVSKVACESLCQLYTDKFGLSTILIRIGSYQPRPDSARTMRTWLSPDDALRAFHAAMTTPEHHTTFYGVSNNAERWWDLADGSKAGYSPIDDSFAHGSFDPLPPETPQGGEFATPEFSLVRMRETI